MRKLSYALSIGAVVTQLCVATVSACTSFRGASSDASDDASTGDDGDSHGDAASAADAGAGAGADASSLADAPTADIDADVTGCGPECLIVFVSSLPYAGSALGGLTGADQKCEDLANEKPKLKGLSWRAWLSTGTSAAYARVKDTGPTTKFKRVDGTVVAPNRNALIDNMLSAPISKDENNEPVTSEVWTGTDYGTYAEPTCNEWELTGSETTGIYGLSSEVNPWWSNKGTRACASVARIYCVQQ